ncbi:oligopeptide/dipeptide ABC transporter ATP-binding protein [Halogeometricum borinquense DSM 11551]|uniref:Oligopeptide/dipeptide ABC transporter ATP-binding protein n=2 Tax=Halogeometricum borinquense TaxID=60847 RepID=E4NTJ2_HALBP|nr:ABC transporter ATP-binding protein [Halogeometricum borinquense]ADQ65937.1 oligopeptide/dipeptide ABC transporter, ATP-binding protein [Halogeometricum borinquense DSM 11551]ELY23093.1 oligopeptide/dipeptide ABC transporter ATP-binding protein [Halogeometricum borinquense DSM 11551]RYJ14169.1 ABC transporter ATP-binding protein [Halogeometricum borinquense]
MAIDASPDDVPTKDDDVLLHVENLHKHFKVDEGWIASILQSVSGDDPDYVHAVDGVSFDLRRGETLGLAGESGCGKTTTGMSLVKLHDATDGDIYYNGKSLGDATDAELKQFRQNAQMIFQDPFESLNPRMTVYDTVAEPLRIHNIANETARVQRALEFAELLPAEQYFDQYPHELSGGQRQRVAIARALVLDPDFIVADEPVSMLDVSLRAGVLSLLERMTEEFGLSVVYISHDLSLLRHMCDRLAIMYMGKIVEKGPTDQIIENPKHPYTQSLINAVPVPEPSVGRERVELQGEVGDVIDIPSGCRFKSRCPEYIGDVCDEVVPPLEEKSDIEGERAVACHLYEDLHGTDPAAAFKSGPTSNVDTGSESTPADD